MTKLHKSNNAEGGIDKMLLAIGKMLLAGLLWLNWLTLTWFFLLEFISVNLATGLLWFLFLVMPVIVSAW